MLFCTANFHDWVHWKDVNTQTPHSVNYWCKSQFGRHFTVRCSEHTHTNTRAQIHAHTHTRARAHAHKYTHTTHTHTHTHAYTHTHTPVHKDSHFPISSDTTIKKKCLYLWYHNFNIYSHIISYTVIYTSWSNVWQHPTTHNTQDPQFTSSSCWHPTEVSKP
jgi:hypothetical protein